MVPKPEERAELREHIKNIYNYAREVWKARLSELGYPPDHIPYPPVLTFEDYWSIVKEDILRRFSRKRKIKKQLQTILETVKDTTQDVFRERVLPLFLEDPGNVPGRLWEEVLDRTIKRLERKDPTYVNTFRTMLGENPKLIEVIFPIILITPHMKKNELRIHPLLHDPSLIKKEKVRKAIKRGLSDFLGIPHLIHFEPEDLPEIMEDERLLDILLHPGVEHTLKLSEDRPIELIRALKEIQDPYYLISKSRDIPATLLHSEVLRELRDLPRDRLIPLLEEISHSKPFKRAAMAVNTEDMKKTMNVLKEDPSLISYLTHPYLIKSADLLLNASRVHKGILLALKEIEKHLDKHSKESVRKLISSALSTRNPDVIRVLSQHPDLVEHYEVLAKFMRRLDRKDIEELLDGKTKWSYLHPNYVERALKHPLGKRILLASLDPEEKRELIENIESLDKEKILEREIAHKLSVEYDKIRLLVKYLGEKAHGFVNEHGDLVAALERRELVPLLLYYKRKGDRLDQEEIAAILNLTRAGTNVGPIHIVRAMENLDRTTVQKVAKIPVEALRGFFLGTLSSPEHLSEELKRFVKTRELISSRIRVRPLSLKERILEIVEKGVHWYDPDKQVVALSEDLQKTLGLRAPTVSEREFMGALKRYVAQSTSKSTRKIFREIRKSVKDTLSKKRKSNLDWIETEKAYTPILEMNRQDVFRLLNFLNSIVTAIDEGNLSNEGLTRDKKHVVFKILRKTHESTAVYNKDFLGYVSNLSGRKAFRRGEKVYIPVEFFKVVQSHPDLAAHPLVLQVRNLIEKKVLRRSSRSSKGRRSSRQR